jgi:hypothetical protein
MDLLIPEPGLIGWTILSLLLLVLPLVSLVSILRSTFKDSITKLLWVLVVILVPFVGPILYFAIGRKQRIQAD